jgi:starvation-inducible outer membrane lipoprotein
MNVMHLSPLTTLTLCAVLSACAATTPFPPKVMEKVSPTFDFQAWRDASPSNGAGKSDAGLTVELGGRIVEALRNGKGIVIVAKHLPIVTHPVYGPAESIEQKGDHEFAFLYSGELDPQDLKNGTRFVMVGTTTGRQPVMVNGVPKTEPFVVASCIHVWQTGRTEVSEVKEGTGGVDSPLQEKTHCVAKH